MARDRHAGQQNGRHVHHGLGPPRRAPERRRHDLVLRLLLYVHRQQVRARRGPPGRRARRDQAHTAADHDPDLGFPPPAAARRLAAAPPGPW